MNHYLYASYLYFCLQNLENSLMILRFLQIRMSTDIERRVGSLLNNTDSTGTAPVNVPSIKTNERHKQPIAVTKPVSEQQTDSSKEKLCVELKERQDKMQVDSLCLEYKCHCNIICL